MSRTLRSRGLISIRSCRTSVWRSTPPLLYIGYVGFSITFSFAVAALILGRIDAAWARWVRPWTLLAWCFLTLGIAMGSYWAYYELGWGGWWFWDPVENASFMPWLAGTALLHSAIVMEKREALKVWTVLLAIFTFSLSLLGTFLVRSGVLTSVHAFATDPARGVFILTLLCIFIGGSLALYAWRAPMLKQGGIFAPISREGGLVLNNLFLTAATAAVFVGTLYPLVLDAITGEKISVGAPFFNLTFGPLMIPLLIAVPYGPVLSWKRGDLLAATQRLYAALGLALVMTLFTFWLWGMEKVLAPLGVGLAVWVMAGAISEIVTRVKFFEIGPKRGFARLWGLPGSAWGTAVAHFGVGVTVLGIVTASAFQVEHIVTMRPGDKVEVSGYEVTFDGAAPRRGPNYTEEVGHFTVRRDGAYVTELDPSKTRLYRAADADHGSWHSHNRIFPALSVAGRRSGRRCRRCPGLFQTPDHPDLDRVGDHVARRALLHGGSTSQDWRTETSRKTQNSLSGTGGVTRWFVHFWHSWCCSSVFFATPVLAVTPDEVLEDPALEARARALSAELRCMVCQNQSIDDSDAPLAKDLRVLVRERLVAGDSDGEVIDYLVSRYGEFVLLKPRFAWHTLILWGRRAPGACGRSDCNLHDVAPQSRGRRPSLSDTAGQAFA